MALLNPQEMRDPKFVGWAATLHFERTQFGTFKEQELLIICVGITGSCLIPKQHTSRLGHFIYGIYHLTNRYNPSLVLFLIISSRYAFDPMDWFLVIDGLSAEAMGTLGGRKRGFL